MVNTIVRCLWLCVLMGAASSYAELTLEITRGKSQATPIAVVPFGKQVALPENIDKIIREDLARSGYFSTLNIGNMVAKPSRAEQVSFGDWRLLRQDYVLVGQVSLQAGQYSMQYALLDVLKQSVLLSKQLTGSRAQLRRMAHSISDDVFTTITGLPSVFSTKILYVTSDRKKTRFQLNYADADGADEKVIFTSRHPIISPAWSPDGKRIAYASFERGRSEIYVQDLKTGKRNRLVSMSGTNSAPAFSPDGRSIAFVRSAFGNPDIYLMDLQTRAIKRLTKHYGIDTEPQFLPDGSGLLFTSSRSGGPQIYKLTFKDKRISRVTFDGNYNARPRITADGKTMIFVHRSGAGFHIASMNLKRRSMRLLSRDTQLDESPSVAPNGSMVVYSATERKRRILVGVSIDGEVRFRLPSKYGDVKEPAWSPINK